MSQDDDKLLAARVRVPGHVVYRDFADETVVLNLETGTYHGLNNTAARMLETIASRDSLASAVEALAAEFGQPEDVIRRDALALCRSLAERGLIEQDASGER